MPPRIFDGFAASANHSRLVGLNCRVLMAVVEATELVEEEESLEDEEEEELRSILFALMLVVVPARRRFRFAFLLGDGTRQLRIFSAKFSTSSMISAPYFFLLDLSLPMARRPFCKEDRGLR